MNRLFSNDLNRLYHTNSIKAQPHQTQRRAFKNDKLFCLSLQGLHCKLCRAALRREIKAVKNLTFMSPRFFGLVLWPITIARRVTCRKKIPSMHNQHLKKPRIFTRRAAPSGAMFAEFCSAARRLVGP